MFSAPAPVEAKQIRSQKRRRCCAHAPECFRHPSRCWKEHRQRSRGPDRKRFEPPTLMTPDQGRPRSAHPTTPGPRPIPAPSPSKTPSWWKRPRPGPAHTKASPRRRRRYKPSTTLCKRHLHCLVAGPGKKGRGEPWLSRDIGRAWSFLKIVERCFHWGQVARGRPHACLLILFLPLTGVIGPNLLSG